MAIVAPITTFQRRYILPFLAVLMLTVSVFVWIILQQQASLLDNELQKKGRVAVEKLSEMSNINILLDDMEKGELTDFVNSDEDIVNAVVFGKDGSLMLSYEDGFRLPPQVSLTSAGEVNLENEWLFTTPIIDNTDNFLGTAAVKISRGRVLKMLEEAATKLIITTIVITLIIASVVYWLLARIRSMANQEIKRAKEIQTAYRKLQNLQSTLRKANETLEVKVVDRTKALQRTNQELQQVNKELKDFAYIVSHDLKAPLRAISSLTDWIIEDYEESFDEDGQEQLSLLKNRVTRMYQLLEGILRYSRIGRGKEEKEVLELNELVDDVINTLLPSENFEIQILGELPPIYADRTKIHQVFQNIISNAIKYNNKPVGKVSISCKTNEEDNLHYFSIADNGKGIPEEDFDRVFKIFQTLEKNKDSAESTGVGLTLVQKVIKKYGGNITVASKVGEGTTFTFSLPPVVEEPI
ncbi:MAG: ATP-binding protein [Saprospiraceae bacterium]